ncbi:tetratricopeptide repeat protein [Planktomarina temperata]|nr:tetratricopeptide repeat protein [Planktomarina temperata]
MIELTIDQALQQGIAAHKAGQIQEADRLYTAILKAQPKHPDANHNMGVLAVGVGKVELALPFFKMALEANPATAQFWLSYIDALIKLDKVADAKAVLDQAKSKGAKGNSFDKLEQRLKEASEEPLAACKTPAEAPPQQQNILDSLKLDQAISLAKKKAKDGSPEEAKHIYQDILTKFPMNKRASDGLKGLTGKTVGKASKNQDPPQDQLQSLVNLYSQGKLQQALKQAETLVQKFPQSAILFNIQGALLKGLGKLDASVEAYKKAIAIKPDYADAYNNTGNALQEQDKLQEAIEAYNKTLAIKPDYADAYNNMGVTLQKQDKLEEALEAYNKALAIKPDYAEAYYNIGVNLQEQDKLQEAIEAYDKALAIKPDYVEAYKNMGIALKVIAFKKPNAGLQKIISSLLDKKSFVRPKDIVLAAISLLKFEPKLKRHLQTSSMAEPEPKLLEAITDLSELPLLLKLMSVCPLSDLALENLLRKLRASLLLSISDLTGSTEELKFQSALALQCFTNEYIYNQSEHEDKALTALEAAIKQTLNNGDQPSPQSILCLASYRPLNQYEWSGSLHITNEIEDVFTRLVVEPNQEAKLKSVLPVLEAITDEVSSKVRDQYEVSPYPRWVNLGLRLQPAPISKVVEEIKLNLFDDAIKEVDAPKILIAGCGTGQHSIGTAARFKGSKVLAIDLSLSSLSYAKRKTEELGIQDIDYMQADILDLGKLCRQFDIVESAGVLHHMDDPLAGWRVLTDSLKPGGLMKIGLYSEMARQHIVEMRQEISKAGIGSSDAAMKSFRTTVMESDKSHHKKILNSYDFYSLSELKDLLFHVQEHRFTIPQIQDCLYQLGLKFCGFESDKIVSQFKLTNTGANDPYDLDRWHTYEEANPGVFFGMYQFWCQKIT